MLNKKRNQILCICFLVISIVFLYIDFGNISTLPMVFTQIDVLLKGIAFVTLCIAAILACVSFENNLYISHISTIVLGIGLAFVYLPVPTPFHSSSFHLLFSSAIAFGITTPAKKVASLISIVVVCFGIIFLFQPLFEVLRNSALYLILPGMIVFSLAHTQKTLCERISIGLIVLGLVSLCQPFLILLYQTGFHLLLGGLTGFIVVAHRS